MFGRGPVSVSARIPCMAIIEVTEEFVRRQADETTFAQAEALVEQGKVLGGAAAGFGAEANVDGIQVRVRFTRDRLVVRCGCAAAPPAAEPVSSSPRSPVPAATESSESMAGPCIHAVAAALAWVRAGTEVPEPELSSVLEGMDSDWLVEQLIELARDVPGVESRLLEAAQEAGGVGIAAARGAARSEVRILREELNDIIDDLLEDAAGHSHYDEWYPDTDELEELFDEAEELLDAAPDEVRELTDHAITLIERVLDTEIVYGTDPSEALERAQDLHFDACVAGSPDLVALAERLVSGALDSGWGVFDDALPSYGQVLGPVGLARYGELLADADGQASDHLLRGLRERFARVEGTGT